MSRYKPFYRFFQIGLINITTCRKFRQFSTIPNLTLVDIILHNRIDKAGISISTQITFNPWHHNQMIVNLNHNLRRASIIDFCKHFNGLTHIPMIRSKSISFNGVFDFP